MPLKNKRSKSDHVLPTAQQVDAANATARLSLGNICIQRSWMNSHYTTTPVHTPSSLTPSTTPSSLTPPATSSSPTPAPNTTVHNTTVHNTTAPVFNSQHSPTVAPSVSQTRQRNASIRNQPNPPAAAEPDEQTRNITPSVASAHSNLPPLRAAHINPPPIPVQHVQFLPSPTPSKDMAINSPQQPQPSATAYATTSPGGNSMHSQNPNAPQCMSHAHQLHPSPYSYEIFSPSACLPKLDFFLSRRPPYRNDEDGRRAYRIDTNRLTRLRHAVVESDYHYIYLSLILSWCTRRESPRPSFLAHIYPDPAGVLIIEQMIGSDSCLTPLTRSFLQNFPIPPVELEKHVSTYTLGSISAHISTSIGKMTLHWPRLINYFKNQSTLPLSRDFSALFGFDSPCLFAAAFKATLRAIWGFDIGNIPEQAFAHFGEELQQFLATKTVTNPEAHFQFYNNLCRIVSSMGPSYVHEGQQPFHQVSISPTATSATRTRPSFSGSNAWQANASALGSPALPNSGNQVPQSFASNAMLIPPLSAPVAHLAQPDPAQMALHQAHLRDPSLTIPARVDATNPEIKPICYRYISDFALSPQKLSRRPIQKMSFQIDAKQLASIPQFEERGQGAPPLGHLDSSSLMFRFRGCEITKDSLSTWANQETIWPTWIYFSLNGTSLELRRKFQHGKHLPVDITRYLQRENTLQVFVNLPSISTFPVNYAVAVEVTTFSKRETLRQECLGRRVLSADDVRASIRSSLANTLRPDASDNDDDDNDDIAITQATVTIPLFEPFSKAKIFDIPVRGADCKHRHAFDLDVFLNTRSCNDGVGYVTKVDDWKCPICSADARPQKLVVDGFLQEVRGVLEAKGLLGTREIIVDADGEWKVKVEVENPRDGGGNGSGGDGDDDDGGGGYGNDTATRPHTVPAKRVVVNLDDDSD